MGLGRQWSHPPLKGAQTHISSALLRMLNVAQGEKVQLTFDLLSLAHTVSGNGDSVNEWVKKTLAQLLSAVDTAATSTSSPTISISSALPTLDDLLGRLGLSPEQRQNVLLLLRLLQQSSASQGGPYELIRPFFENWLASRGLNLNNITSLTSEDIDRLRAALTYSWPLTGTPILPPNPPHPSLTPHRRSRGRD